MERAGRVKESAKLELLAAIAATGVREVEATAFVSPSKVPALADAPELAAALADYPDIEFSALVASPNGAHRAIAAGFKNYFAEIAGEPAAYDASSLVAAVLRGLLETATTDRVNLVNAATVAKARGMLIDELKLKGGPSCEDLDLAGSVGAGKCARYCLGLGAGLGRSLSAVPRAMAGTKPGRIFTDEGARGIASQQQSGGDRRQPIAHRFLNLTCKK